MGPSLVESIETTYDLERRTCAAGEQGRVAHVGFCSVRGLTLSVLRESGRSGLFFMSPLLRLCSAVACLRLEHNLGNARREPPRLYHAMAGRG